MTSALQVVLGTQQYSPKLELLRTLAAQHAAYQVMLHSLASSRRNQKAS